MYDKFVCANINFSYAHSQRKKCSMVEGSTLDEPVWGRIKRKEER